ncbi:hypothetical protein [Rariglobus hedericola]|uniref:HlyD family efflux transporter periplasmic adaptor subunit n=1 Tax=Rariglobus hedericola TaxID=2597822 RepID=A0A556QIW4_9BACT|nr:hypothetical protein [Rariglobus hedericola]TSJ76551.1 hypothetical protein FPL22_10490 [Rariglobus hedericola]
MSGEPRQIFSESWHRVAGQRLRLRPSVRMRRQSYRGEPWFVAQDSFTEAFYRFRPEAYDFIARLDGSQTVEEVWKGCLDRSPDTAPGQSEVVSLLAQLYQANLLAGDTPGDAARLFARHQKRAQRELASQFFGIFFLRVRLLDPDRFLSRVWPSLRWLATRWGVAAWSALLVLGIGMVISNWDRAVDQSAGVLAPGNLLLLYAAFTVAKLIHEFGHGFAVKAFGGEVHAMGVTFLVFTPIPYVDATAAWAFRERWKRVMVGCAGMIPEMAYAAIAAVVWAGTGTGTINTLAYNTMITASVSTLLFNLNPLLRFDGYYILSDLLDVPNLQGRSFRQWLHLVETKVFHARGLESPGRTPAGVAGFLSFGAASWVYRIIITVTIILLVADRYFGLGLLAGVITGIGAFIIPVVKAVQYLLREPRIERVRRRAWAFSAGAVVFVIILLGVIPFPQHFRAPGVVRAAGSRDVYTSVGGWAAEAKAVSGSSVQTGETLVRMESPELVLELMAAKADLQQVEARERQMLSDLAAGIEPMKRRREAVQARLERLEKDRTALNLISPSTGQWVSPRSDDWAGLWLPRGARVGEVVGPGREWEFFAVVDQNDARSLFAANAAKERAEVRFHGSSGRVLTVTGWSVVPGRQEVLPSPALGWKAHGPIRVRADDEHGMRADQPFFLVTGRIPVDSVKDSDEPGPVLWQGRTGVMRFDMPWSPLLVQWVRSFRQLLQERYRI